MVPGERQPLVCVPESALAYRPRRAVTLSIGVGMGDLTTTLADTDLEHRSETAINAYVQSRRHNINPGI
jgi:hypothetical protein